MSITPVTPVYAPHVRVERNVDDVNRRLCVSRKVWEQVDQDRDVGNRELRDRIRGIGKHGDLTDVTTLVDLMGYCHALVERNLRDAA